MAEHDEGSKDLIGRACQGDPAAQQLSLSQHRDRLRQMVRFRLAPRLAARLDDSDVVQEVLAEAARKLPEYLRHMPMPMYPWLRRIAGERLTKLHRDHLAASKRSAARELPIGSALPDQSAMVLANRLISSRSSPSAQAIGAEQRDRVRQCLAELSEPDREGAGDALRGTAFHQRDRRSAGRDRGRHQDAPLPCPGACASCWDRCWEISGSTTVTDPSMPGAQFLIGQVYFDSLMVPLDVPDLAPSLRERYTADQLALLPAEANVPFTVRMWIVPEPSTFVMALLAATASVVCASGCCVRRRSGQEERNGCGPAA